MWGNTVMLWVAQTTEEGCECEQIVGSCRKGRICAILGKSWKAHEIPEEATINWFTIKGGEKMGSRGSTPKHTLPCTEWPYTEQLCHASVIFYKWRDFSCIVDTIDQYALMVPNFFVETSDTLCSPLSVSNSHSSGFLRISSLPDLICYIFCLMNFILQHRVGQ